MVDQMESGSRPWWSYVRYSLRGMIVLILLVGGVLGWIVHSARVQRVAIATIRRAGGSVWYDWQLKNGRVNRNGKLVWPKWLVDQLGVDYFGHVVSVLLGEQGSDRELAHVGRLSQLKYLSLNRSRVTDAGLRSLEGLTHLEELSLRETAVTDPGLVHLRRLAQLKQLDLSLTEITSTGLVHLVGLNQLTDLSLRATQIDDHGMTHLEKLSNLQRLDLTNDTRITDAGLAYLKRLSGLRALTLWNVKFTSGGLKELRRASPGVKMTY